VTQWLGGLSMYLFALLACLVRRLSTTTLMALVPHCTHTIKSRGWTHGRFLCAFA
jgi:hypothetical protein